MRANQREIGGVIARRPDGAADSRHSRAIERAGGRLSLRRQIVTVVENAVANGIFQLWVGELVVEAIESNWPYILTDTQFEPLLDARVGGIKAGLDKIRDRVARR
jgi:hypothetical protein